MHTYIWRDIEIDTLLSLAQRSSFPERGPAPGFPRKRPALCIILLYVSMEEPPDFPGRVPLCLFFGTERAPPSVFKNPNHLKDVR